jgi:hypothetical protein
MAGRSWLFSRSAYCGQSSGVETLLIHSRVPIQGKRKAVYFRRRVSGVPDNRYSTGFAEAGGVQVSGVGPVIGCILLSTNVYFNKHMLTFINKCLL